MDFFSQCRHLDPGRQGDGDVRLLRSDGDDPPLDGAAVVGQLDQRQAVGAESAAYEKIE